MKTPGKMSTQVLSLNTEADTQISYSGPYWKIGGQVFSDKCASQVNVCLSSDLDHCTQWLCFAQEYGVQMDALFEGRNLTKMMKHLDMSARRII